MPSPPRAAGPAASPPALTRAALVACVALVACGDERQRAARGDEGRAAAEATRAAEAAETAARKAAEDELNREWPLHGLVTGLQLILRKEPTPEAMAIGSVRIGSRVRLRGEPVKTPTCATGWYEVRPRGFVCAGQGITVAASPPTTEFELAPPDRARPLPYDYWYAKDDAVPEYHRLPSRDEQREAVAFAERYLALRAKNEALGERFRRGELAGDLAKPAVLHRLLDRGAFVAGAGVEERAFRKFIRTVRGRFLKQAQLEPRAGSTFEGVALEGGATLPVAWVVRGGRPLLRRDKADGSVKFVEDAEAAPLERHARVANWLGRTNVGGTVYHRLAWPDGSERHVKDWFLAVAEKVDRPREVKRTEPWAHVDLSAQTLVVYRGDDPVYATLVSTGLPGFETPTGLFEIHAKYVADTMANVGDTLDDRYSIEDVPWTQYFKGAFALHGAFWHNGFGLQRSHGCVNLAPKDAHHVFDLLEPAVPEGWLGVIPALTAFPESHVLVTP